MNASVQNNEGPTKGENSVTDFIIASSRMLPNVPVYTPDDPTGYHIDPVPYLLLMPPTTNAD